jgi:exodeoxyribonuclease VII small subunit
MELSYEIALQELQKITQDLQEGQIPIDDLAGKLQRAAELIRFCREKLRQTESEIQGLFDDDKT